jgi:hypothetical protein
MNLPSMQGLARVHAIISTSRSLADEVMEAVQDASFTYEAILELFNDCLLELAGELMFPDLERWIDIETTAHDNFIHLPADYMRKLRHCHSITHNRPVEIYGSAVQLFRRFTVLDQSGRVIGVAVNGRTLIYQRIPASSETLKINYYAYPPRLQTCHDKPLIMPWHLAKALLKHYACKEIFSLIEDGIEGAQVNTDRHEKRYEIAKERLWQFIGPEEKSPVDIETEIDWEAYS